MTQSAIIGLSIILTVIFIVIGVILLAIKSNGRDIGNIGWLMIACGAISFGAFIYGCCLPKSHDAEIYQTKIERLQKEIDECQLTGKAKEVYVLEREDEIAAYNSRLDRLIEFYK